jgi:hypothetical protein
LKSLDDGQRQFELLFLRRGRSWRTDDWYVDMAFGALPSFEIESLLARETARQIAKSTREYSELQVSSIEHSSPGVVDLAGLGRVVKEVRLFVDGVIDRVVHSPDRALAREEKKQDILAKKLANAKKLLELKDKHLLDQELARALLKEALSIDHFMEDKVLDGKLISVDGGPHTVKSAKS